MPRFRPAVALLATCVVLGCKTRPPSAPVSPNGHVPVAGHAPAGGHATASARPGEPLAARNLALPPRNNNDHLDALYPAAAHGGKTSKADVANEFALSSGKQVAALPRTSSVTHVKVHLHRSGSAMQLLAFGRQLLDDGEDVDEGMGAFMPAEEEEVDLDNVTADEESPFFEAASEAEPYHIFDAPPDHWDLRDHTEVGLMPPVRQQLTRSTCVFHSTAAYLDYLYRVTDPAQGASPQFMYWLYHLEIVSKIKAQASTAFTDVGTYNGLWHPCLHIDGNRDVGDMWPYVPVQQGTLTEAEVPYQPTVGNYGPVNDDYKAVAVKALGQNIADKIASGAAFTSHGAYFVKCKCDVATFEAALAGGQPIQVGFPVVGDDWYNPALKSVPALDAASDQHYNAVQFAKDGSHQYSVIPEPDPDKVKNAGGHSVLLVGYVHDTSAPGGGYFVVRNSWSDGWGDGGYALISYASAINYAYESFVATKYDNAFNATFSVAPPPQDPPPLTAVSPLPSVDPETPPPSEDPLPSPEDSPPVDLASSDPTWNDYTDDYTDTTNNGDSQDTTSTTDENASPQAAASPEDVALPQAFHITSLARHHKHHGRRQTHR